MPYLKQRAEPFQKMRKLLLGYEFNGERLAQVLGCSRPTGCDRMKDPGKLTLNDLERIHRKGHVPIEELREAIVL